MANNKIEVKLKIDKELWKTFKETVEERLSIERGLSGTVTNLIKEYIKDGNTPKKSNTHTHETITKKKIEKLIQEYKGMDSRTIRKYEPLIISKLLEDGFKQHPANQELLIKYNL